MSSQKKVSIITASFNNVFTITDTFNSVLSQNYSNIEYIIIDGCSTDGTLDIIESYKPKFKAKFKSFKLLVEKDEGIADAWNKGLKLAKGDVIFFLNSDDWISSDTVTKASKRLTIDRKEITYGICNRVDEHKNYLESFQKKFFKHRVFWDFGFSFTTCFCTKEVYDKIEGFNTDYKIGIDTDFLLRCLKNNVKFIKGNHEVYMRIGGVSTKFREKAQKEYKKALLKNGYPKLLVNLVHLLKK